MHAGKVAAYWYATAIVLVVSALLRLVSEPMAVPVWLPAAELAAGVGIGALAWWVGRGAKPSRVVALMAGPVLVAAAVALYLIHIAYEMAAFPAVLGTIVAASSAAAFVRARDPVGAPAAGWQGYGAGYQPPYAPVQGWPEPAPQYAPQYRPHHVPTVTEPPSTQPTGQSSTQPTGQGAGPGAAAAPPAAPRTPYPSSREGAEQHLLQARVRRRPRHAATQGEPQPPPQPSGRESEHATEPVRPSRPVQSPGDGGFTPDDHPDVEVAPRRRRHGKQEPEDPGPAGEPPATP